MILTDEVARGLFEEYEAHRQSDRYREETGWTLLGRRDGDTATVLATLPAGAERDAGEEHVRFNADAQALASRILRQDDKRLVLLGVVHTHPGTLRHPSRGDFRGDRGWVQRLRGRQGVFAIGTIDDAGSTIVAEQPKANVLRWRNLRFDWYSLAEGADNYCPLPVELTMGPDLAAYLRPSWSVIEAHAERLERLVVQQTGVRFALAEDGRLIVSVPLAEPGRAIRVILDAKSARYFIEENGDHVLADLPAGTQPDHGVYLLLAELTKD